MDSAHWTCTRCMHQLPSRGSACVLASSSAQPLNMSGPAFSETVLAGAENPISASDRALCHALPLRYGKGARAHARASAVPVASVAKTTCARQS
eukprot:scaffold162245_cov32-Tisochrysis_lutea.AAC.4